MDSLPKIVREAWAAHADEAKETYRVFVEYCGGTAPCRVPGMDTVLRLAVRHACGKNTEQAAAREYLYRWHLALNSPIFGVPHLLGA